MHVRLLPSSAYAANTTCILCKAIAWKLHGFDEKQGYLKVLQRVRET